jgi:hypothetical protein
VASEIQRPGAIVAWKKRTPDDKPAQDFLLDLSLE